MRVAVISPLQSSSPDLTIALCTSQLASGKFAALRLAATITKTKMDESSCNHNIHSALNTATAKKLNSGEWADMVQTSLEGKGYLWSISRSKVPCQAETRPVS